MLLCPALRLAMVAHFLTQKRPVKISKELLTTSIGAHELSHGLRVDIHSSIGDLNEKDWDEVRPSDNLFLRSDFLKTFEAAAPDTISFRYGLLYKNGVAIASFYFQIILINSAELELILKPLTAASKTPKWALQWGEWLKRTKEEKGFRILINGNNFISGEYGVGIRDEAQATIVYTALAETIAIILNSEKQPTKISNVLVKDYFDKKGSLPSDALQKNRYHRFKVEPEMIVDVDPSWVTKEEYIGAMSKKYRNRARSVFRSSGSLEVKEIGADEIDACEAELYELYQNLHKRAKFKLSGLGRNYFSLMKKAFPEAFRIFIYSKNGQMLAFRSSFLSKDHIEAHFIGIDYSVNKENCIYQRILYDFIEEGIEAKKKQVFLGRTAAEMKSTVGAKAHDLICYMRHRNSISNQVLRPFIDYLRPSEWTPRNPFKD